MQQLTKDFAIHSKSIVAFDRNWNSPFQISGQRCWKKTILQTSVNDLSFGVDHGVW